jgi:invasion protein IalB
MARPTTPRSRLALAIVLIAFTSAGGALAQAAGGKSSAAKKGEAPAAAQEPTASVVASFGNWTLLCGKEAVGKDQIERCSLVLPLVEKTSQKLVFRVIVTYGPEGRLVLRIDGPTGVALQRGLEFSPDTREIYRMAFQTCLPLGCKALLLLSDDLKKKMIDSKQSAITVYALNGKAVQTVTSLKGLAEGLAVLDKHVGREAMH